MYLNDGFFFVAVQESCENVAKINDNVKTSAKFFVKVRFSPVTSFLLLLHFRNVSQLNFAKERKYRACSWQA